MDYFAHSAELRGADDQAEQLIASEVARQNVLSLRAPTSKGQLIMAALAYARATDMIRHNTLDRGREALFDHCKALYAPSDWPALTDQGTDIANLVAAAAFIQQEVKRRIILGETS